MGWRRGGEWSVLLQVKFTEGGGGELPSVGGMVGAADHDFILKIFNGLYTVIMKVTTANFIYTPKIV